MHGDGSPETTIDLEAARVFVATHGRILDRRRLEFVIDRQPADGAVSALDAYRNPDGGYGWGLEPDLRSTTSQPAAAMHALEVLAEAGPAGGPRAAALCDWLARCSNADGGLPFAHPVEDPAGTAVWWQDPGDGRSSLQMTAQVAGNAHRAARHDPAVRDHPWLARATDWTLATISAIDSMPPAYELLFAVRFLDAAADTVPSAGALLTHLRRFIPADGVVAVHGGVEGEAVRPLDFLLERSDAARRLFDPAVLDAELRRLARRQQPDGGWTVDFPSASPAATLEWRAYATIGALKHLT